MTHAMGKSEAGQQSRAPDEHMYADMGRFVEELARVIEAVRYEVEPAMADSPVSALSRAWCAPAAGAHRIHVPLPARHGAGPCSRTCGVRWLCEMSLSRRRGAGGLGRLIM